MNPSQTLMNLQYFSELVLLYVYDHQSWYQRFWTGITIMIKGVSYPGKHNAFKSIYSFVLVTGHRRYGRQINYFPFSCINRAKRTFAHINGTWKWLWSRQPVQYVQVGISMLRYYKAPGANRKNTWCAWVEMLWCPFFLQTMAQSWMSYSGLWFTTLY